MWSMGGTIEWSDSRRWFQNDLGRIVHFVIEELQPIQLSFAFLVSFNMHGVKGDG